MASWTWSLYSLRGAVDDDRALDSARGLPERRIDVDARARRPDPDAKVVGGRSVGRVHAIRVRPALTVDTRGALEDRARARDDEPRHRRAPEVEPRAAGTVGQLQLTTWSRRRRVAVPRLETEVGPPAAVE